MAGWRGDLASRRGQARFPAPCPPRCRPPADRARPAGRAAMPQDRDGERSTAPSPAPAARAAATRAISMKSVCPGSPAATRNDRRCTGISTASRRFRAEHHRQHAGGVQAGGGDRALQRAEILFGIEPRRAAQPLAESVAAAGRANPAAAALPAVGPAPSRAAPAGAERSSSIRWSSRLADASRISSSAAATTSSAASVISRPISGARSAIIRWSPGRSSGASPRCRTRCRLPRRLACGCRADHGTAGRDSPG